MESGSKKKGGREAGGVRKGRESGTGITSGGGGGQKKKKNVLLPVFQGRLCLMSGWQRSWVFHCSSWLK